MTDKRHAHLVIIQGVVTRLAQNSFLLKGWSVVLISALFALAAKDANAMFVGLAYFPLVAFWLLDGYFLWQERLYRKLYDHVRTLNEEQVDFSMNTSAVSDGAGTWLSAAFSKTLLLFHGVLFVSLLIVMLTL